MGNVFKTIVGVVLFVLLLVTGPLLVIWSLNTLIPALAIEFTLETWCAVVILGAVFRANVPERSVNWKD